jgi:uncharacterized protein YozE (UPF0346 family)
MKKNKQLEKISGLSINEAEYDLLNNGKGKIAVLIYTGSADPKKILDYAVSVYVENEGYHELIDAHLDNPWIRVILSDINNMSQRQFDPNTDRLKKISTNS